MLASSNFGTNCTCLVISNSLLSPLVGLAMLNSLGLFLYSIRAFSNSNLACILTYSSSICVDDMSVDSIAWSSNASYPKIGSYIVCTVTILIISFFYSLTFSRLILVSHLSLLIDLSSKKSPKGNPQHLPFWLYLSASLTAISVFRIGQTIPCLLLYHVGQYFMSGCHSTTNEQGKL